MDHIQKSAASILDGIRNRLPQSEMVAQEAADEWQDSARRHGCDRDDFDGIQSLPTDWLDVHEVQTYHESVREVDFRDTARSPFDWQTHLGTCPECQRTHK